ncbi:MULTISPECIES: hypothetical protein [unclassified Streptomyces]|uniref:hypothetical protein n=1 Tax=unclassified Streptomyces TaxID=2593676 RepID=UPI002252897B|nr:MULTISPECIES: hypothetical protein [unclassified Streptomyces]MCX4871094.1 hypothetical protein [Streptomyces sp. NBC_00906]MCX4902716.1 hypothetical protein [Streptomyces sp. NBC_00892]
MHSMTALLAVDTLPDPATSEKGQWLADMFGTVWNWGADILPGGNLTMLGLLWGLGTLADQATKKKAGAASTSEKGFWGGVVGVAKSLWGGLTALFKAARAIVRFYGGRELHGPARSTATFWAAGTRIEKGDDQAVSMGSVAFAPPRISLIKQPRRAPSLWARKAAVWFRTYRGRGAWWLDRATRVVLWTARVTGKGWRAGRTTARTLRNWGCWPYAARGLVRVIVTALVVFAVVPAWDVWAALVALLGTAALVGAFLPKMVPAEPGDDVVYGPKLWVVLRDDLKLPDDEPWKNWLQLPTRLADENARIVLRLPWTYRGSDAEKESITALLNSRLPGEWAGRFSFRGEHATAVYTHKPAPKPPAPAPEPPAAVNIWDPKVQEILAGLGPDDFYLGQNALDRPVIQKMADEQNSWALSIGSGGGKSAFLQWLAVQMLMKRGTIVAIDPKMVSLTPLIGIKGVHEYINPRAPLDMRAALEWVAEVLAARNFEKKTGRRTSFPPLYVFLEEANHLADILKEQHSADKKTGESSADPVWRDVASILRLGREVNVHIIAVFQDFKDNQFGGVSLTPLFPMKFLGSYTENQWKRIMGSRVEMPPIQKKAGRMVLALDTGDVTRIQTPYAPWNPDMTKDENQREAYRLLTAYYKELRATHGHTTEALYQAPPEPSEEEPPAFIQALSRDESPNGPIGVLEGGLSDETAGRLSHDGVDVTLSGADVTPSRDRLHLVPTQGGTGAQEAAPADPTAPPELLSLAEISRRLGPTQGIPKSDTLRAHKTRREDFPKPTIINGKELFTESQIIAYYAAQEKNA